MKTSLVGFALLLLVPTTAPSQTDADAAAIRKTLDSWNEGWSKGDAALAVTDYAEETDWTNAFGDRFQGREELQQGLDHIFSLDFLMAGNSGSNEYEDVTFLEPDVALLRSKLVRVGQKTATGATMPDRHIHHLRVLKRLDGKWQIVSHLISQAQPKTSKSVNRK